MESFLSTSIHNSLFLANSTFLPLVIGKPILDTLIGTLDRPITWPFDGKPANCRVYP